MRNLLLLELPCRSIFAMAENARFARLAQEIIFVRAPAGIPRGRTVFRRARISILHFTAQRIQCWWPRGRKPATRSMGAQESRLGRARFLWLWRDSLTATTKSPTTKRETS